MMMMMMMFHRAFHRAYALGHDGGTKTCIYTVSELRRKYTTWTSDHVNLIWHLPWRDPLLSSLVMDSKYARGPEDLCRFTQK